MKSLLTLGILLTISILSGFSQSTGPTSMILRYEKVTEFVFDQASQDYVEKDSVEFSGAISVDPSKVFIRSYNNQPNKILKIIGIQKEEGTGRDLYFCEMSEEKYAVAISPDKKYLTQIGSKDKYIYQLKSSSTDKKEVIIFKIDGKSKINN